MSSLNSDRLHPSPFEMIENSYLSLNRHKTDSFPSLAGKGWG